MIAKVFDFDFDALCSVPVPTTKLAEQLADKKRVWWKGSLLEAITEYVDLGGPMPGESIDLPEYPEEWARRFVRFFSWIRDDEVRLLDDLDIVTWGRVKSAIEAVAPKHRAEFECNVYQLLPDCIAAYVADGGSAPRLPGFKAFDVQWAKDFVAWVQGQEAKGIIIRNTKPRPWRKSVWWQEDFELLECLNDGQVTMAQYKYMLEKACPKHFKNWFSGCPYEAAYNLALNNGQPDFLAVDGPIDSYYAYNVSVLLNREYSELPKGDPRPYINEHDLAFRLRVAQYENDSDQQKALRREMKRLGVESIEPFVRPSKLLPNQVVHGVKTGQVEKAERPAKPAAATVERVQAAATAERSAPAEQVGSADEWAAQAGHVFGEAGQLPVVDRIYFVAGLTANDREVYMYLWQHCNRRTMQIRMGSKLIAIKLNKDRRNIQVRLQRLIKRGLLSRIQNGFRIHQPRDPQLG